MIPGSLRGGAVIDGLVALARDTFSGDDMTIFDGPRSKKHWKRKVLLIGWDPNSPIHVIERRVTDENLGGRQLAVGEVACYIATGNGSGDIKRARDDAVGILTRLEAAIRADRTGLGGACDLAEVGPDAGVWQNQTSQDAATVGLPFTVSYEAYI